MYKFLNDFEDVNDLKKMSFQELNRFSKEIREFLVDKVSNTGGHLASNLGVVELTLSLYKVFNMYEDKIVWDVGHQTYVHKILTGRKDNFNTLRQYNGMSGFPKQSESKFDIFDTGHSSTSISAALGIARARDLKKDDYHVIAVIGDGALTGGMALEAINDVGDKKSNLIIVLNDNQMSIAKNVGGMSTYLSKIRLDPKYNKFKNDFNDALKKTNIGSSFAATLKKVKSGIKQMVVPGMFFEDIGIKYLGPIDGHNIKELTKIFNMAKDVKGPVIIHVITKKGKGYKFAEKNPDKFHGISSFDKYTGEVKTKKKTTYSKVFGEEMVSLASKNENIIAITAAMRDGTGLCDFSKIYKERFFDVGIAEQHAVTLAAGFAKEGLKPVFAVYSTFLQRAYDQVLQDICLQNLPVVLAIDRAGIVGNDGETHQGIFDISYLSHMPNITIMSPKCIEELKYMLRWSVNQKFPIAIRYPRGCDSIDVTLEPVKTFVKGKWETIYKKGNIAIIAVGKMVQTAIKAKEKLKAKNIDVTVISASFIKPIDKKLLDYLIVNNYKIVTVEDNVKTGGFGSMVLNYVNESKKCVKVFTLGYDDKFITHGNVDLLYKLNELDADGITESIMKII